MAPKKEETTEKVEVKKNLCKCWAWKRNNKIYSEQTPNWTLLCSNCN